MCAPGEAHRGSGVPRSPSHESVTTDLSLFSVSSAASDAKVLRMLACKAGQGPDPSTLRGVSPNPDSKNLGKRAPASLPLSAGSRLLLQGCAALRAALGLRRSASEADLPREGGSTDEAELRGAVSEVGAALALCSLAQAQSRCCSTWAAAGGGGGSQLPSPQRGRPQHAGDNKARQSYIHRRLMSTYKALERMSQSDFNLDNLEAAAVSAVAAVAGPGPTSLVVPQHKMPHSRFVHPEAAHLALTAADLERERGRPLSKYERNMMIFNWLHTLDEAQPF